MAHTEFAINIIYVETSLGVSCSKKKLEIQLRVSLFCLVILLHRSNGYIFMYIRIRLEQNFIPIMSLLGCKTDYNHSLHSNLCIIKGFMMFEY